MDTFNLKITSAVVIDGEIATAGKIVFDVEENLAKNLLSRGKAVVATEADAPSAAPEPAAQIDAKPAKGGKAKATEADAQ